MRDSRFAAPALHIPRFQEQDLKTSRPHDLQTPRPQDPTTSRPQDLKTPRPGSPISYPASRFWIGWLPTAYGAVLSQLPVFPDSKPSMKMTPSAPEMEKFTFEISKKTLSEHTTLIRAVVVSGVAG